jgi:1-acyl-sn-glycerol-3-phosphate acyltransferase
MFARRLLSFPLLWAACLLAWALSPALLALALVADVFRRRLRTTRFFAFVLVLLTAELAGVVAALSIGREARVNYALQRAWAGQLWGWAARLYDLKLEVGGDPLPRGPFSSFWRHASYADTVLPIVTMASPARFPRYVLKHELLWDPCLDLVGNRLPNRFVRREAGGDEQLVDLAALARTCGPQDFVVLYPEGTRFSYARQARARARVPEAWRAAADALTHTLPPRPAGALAVLDAGHDVVFVAHAGLEGSARLGSLLRGAILGSTVRVHFRVVRAADVPATREDRIAWLYAEWAKVDAFVARHVGA